MCCGRCLDILGGTGAWGQSENESGADKANTRAARRDGPFLGKGMCEVHA
jgi:hypothetical protein